MNIGLIQPNSIERIKRDFLLFDKLYIVDDSWRGFKSFYKDLKESIDPKEAARTIDEFDYLLSNDLLHLVSANKEADRIISNTTSSQEGAELFLHLLKSQQQLTTVFKDSNKFYDAKLKNAKSEVDKHALLMKKERSTNEILTRHTNLLLEHSEPNVNFTPIITNTFEKLNSPNVSEPNILELTLNKLPIPSEQVSWERLIDFKADEDAQLKIKRLKRWIRDLSRKDLNPIEAKEEIDYLLHEYTNHMKLHKLNYKISTFSVVLNLAISMTSILDKINLIGNVSDKLLKFKKNKIDFLIGEGKAPGKEIAYLAKVKDEFKN